MIDSLDVMLIMGLDEHYERCRKWIADNLEFGMLTPAALLVSRLEATLCA